MAKGSEPILSELMSLVSQCIFAVLVALIGGIFQELCAQSPDIRHLNFGRADSVAALYPNYSLANMKDLSDKLTIPFDNDVEKFRAIYKWVCDNISNDFEYFERNRVKREKLKDDSEALAAWDRKFAPQVYKRLLQQHSTVCTGYAYLVRELAYHAGIESEIINGYGRNAEANIGGSGVANHSWNAVELNGEWYLCDATWSSGTIDTQNELFIRSFREAYFLTPPEVFVLNHFPLDSNWLLMEDKPSLDTFLNRPLVYNEGIGNQILPLIPNEFRINATRRVPVDFYFTAPANPEQLALQVIQGSHVVDITPLVSAEADGRFKLTHTFVSRGTYAVHVRSGAAYLFTYEVRVTK